MMTRAFLAFSLFCGAVLLLAAKSAFAGPVISAMHFDLAPRPELVVPR